MDIFCTTASMAKLKLLSPDEVRDYLDTYDSPNGYIFVTNELDTVYLLAVTDLKADSRLIGEQYMSIEHFENGIPSWLGTLPMLTIYLAEWNGQEWDFTKVSGK